jgi:hypothetical protein
MTVHPWLAIDGETSFCDIEPRNPMFSRAPFSDGVFDGIAFRQKYFTE